MVQWFFLQLSLLNLEKNMKFSDSTLWLLLGCMYKVAIAYVIVDFFYQKIQVKFEFGPGLIIFDSYPSLDMEKTK
jgi:hypothetical protein